MPAGISADVTVLSVRNGTVLNVQRLARRQAVPSLQRLQHKPVPVDGTGLKRVSEKPMSPMSAVLTARGATGIQAPALVPPERIGTVQIASASKTASAVPLMTQNFIPSLPAGFATSERPLL